MFPDEVRRVHREAGFTLIEVMIVVAVIALLAGVALPAYQESLRKARRSDARIALTTASQMLERYNTEKNTYATATFGAVADAASGVVFQNKSENKYYNLSLPLANLGVNTFLIKAEPTGSQATDACGTFTLNQAGVRTVTGGTLSAAECQWE